MNDHMNDDDFDRDDLAPSNIDALGIRKRSMRKRLPSFAESPDFRFDYKDPQKLKLFISERGKIVPRRVSGLNAKQQRQLTREIKRARNLALIPYTTIE